MKSPLVTSISLPDGAAVKWRRHRQEIMQFAQRYLRIQMRKEVQRGVTRRYNRTGVNFRIISVRFTAAEYDTLHYVAAALRVSVSSLIFGIIQLWLKPARRILRRFFSINYGYSCGKWDPEAGFLEEMITFWRLNLAPPQTASCS